jgi:AcrR family transcriptional regulator
MTASSQSSTRDRALAIATELFAERGFHGVSLAHIGEALGYSKQTVLHHFTSKEKLYGEVLTRIAGEFEALIDDAFRNEATPEARLQRVILSLQHSGSASRTRTRLLVRELMEVEARGAAAKTWPLRDFLDALTALGRSLQSWSDKSDDEVFAALYQLIGAVSYFSISEAALSGMYGRRRSTSIKRAFGAELSGLLDCAMAAPSQRSRP